MKNYVVLMLFFTLLIGCEKTVLLEDANPNTETSLKVSPLEITVPDDFPSIQLAIEKADNGATITIKQGIYPELIMINERENLTLIGQGALICPPDGIAYGEGVFNIEVLNSTNIKILNLKFDGKIHEKTKYPIDRAIAFNGSSGEMSNNKFTGYGLGIATDNQYHKPQDIPVGPDPDAMIDIKISKNTFTDCFGQISVTGNYTFIVEHNIITYSYDPSLLCNFWFPHWYGIEIESGTGTISKNKIKLKSGSKYKEYSVGIRLMKRDAADHIQGYMVDLHDVDVTQNIIMGTGSGICVNSYDPLPDPEVWCVLGVRLIKNKFIKVGLDYEINNECEEIVIAP